MVGRAGSDGIMSSDAAQGRKRYFEALYAKDPDPWRYHACEYEIDKRADTLGFLKERYASACEVGCSIGVLTAELAPRCDALVGIDISPTAAEIARRTVGAFPQVEIKVLHLPHEEPDLTLDLLVLSEMLYFLDEGEIASLADFAARRVVPGGDVLIVSYDGETQTRLDGPASTAAFLAEASAAFEVVRAEQREEYHVRLLRRRQDDA